MKYLTHITHIFKSLVHPHPMRDWYILLFSAMLVAFALVGVGVYFFIGIQAGFIVGGQPESATQTHTVSREGLRRTIETYEVRSVNYSEKNYPVPPLTDPSR